jgi:hypothetical protein
MAIVENLANVLNAIRSLPEKYRQGKRPNVVVGYTAAYAVYVHENLEAHHDNGQAKFLEQPARTMTRELTERIRADVKAGVSLQESLLAAGLLLQRESQKLVPVDTGNLRASAFTRIEE